MKKNIVLATLVLTLGATALASCSSENSTGSADATKSADATESEEKAEDKAEDKKDSIGDKVNNAITSIGVDGLNKNPDDIRAMAFYNVEASDSEETINYFSKAQEDMEFNQLAAPVKGDLVAIIETSEGTVKVKLLPNVAPKAVKNFVEHSLNDYYDGIEFHRVINDFMIQGGDPQGTGMGGESIWGKGFAFEVNKNARHFSGALAMANSGTPASNGSQFYLVDDVKLEDALITELDGFSTNQDGVLQHMHQDVPAGEENVYHEGDLKIGDMFPQAVIDAYKEKGGVPFLDFGYTVFGQTYEGLEIIDLISQTETGENDKPVNKVTITDITIGIVK